MGRGGAYVPAHVVPSRAHSLFIPRAQCVCFWYGNAAMRMFGWARRHRPYVFGWKGSAGLIVHQGADVLAVHHALEVAIDVHVEHIDGQVVFLAHGGGGEVHHF